jgi:hypothetical protein
MEMLLILRKTDFERAALGDEMIEDISHLDNMAILQISSLILYGIP